MSDALKPGDTFNWRGSPARVMAVADGWIMARRPGCVPFVVFAKDIPKGRSE